jgi:PKD repeat protein
MRKLVLVFVVIVIGQLNVQATHIAGADFNYTCVGQDSFYVTLNLFRDCTGYIAPSDGEVLFTSSCGGNFTVDLVKINGLNGTEISQLCPGAGNVSTCNGGTMPGMQQHIYSGLVVLSPPCDTWTMTWDLCCRNSSVNLVGQPEMLVQATINTVTDSCNNSPIFNAQPILYVCQNQAVNYNFGVSEIDGDSLVYSFIHPLDKLVAGNAVQVPFSGGYTFNQPIAGISLNTSTGQLAFTPTVQGNFVLAVQVCEYDYTTGALLGCIVRDIQFVVIVCNNLSPQAPPGGISSFTGTGALVAPDSVEVCLGNTFSFDLVFTDANVADSVTLTTNITQIIPGSTFSITNGNPAIITVSGVATSNLPYLSTFIVTAVDNACPIPASTSVAYNIITTQKPTVNANSVPLTCVDDVPVQLSGATTNAIGSLWSGGNGSFTNALNSINNSYTPTGPELSSGAVNLYLSTTGTGNCAQADDTLTLNFTDFNALITPNSTDVICNGGNTGTASLGLLNGTSPYTAVWNTTPVQSGLMATNLAMGTYQVTITDGNGCDSTSSVTVIEHPVLTSSTLVISNVSCTGGNDGSAVVNVNGGVGPYQYLWSNLQNETTDTATTLTVGTFYVTVTDSAGCSIIDSVIITEPVSPLSMTSNEVDITCFGLTNGSANATPSGGTNPYNYSWSNGSNSNAISGLSDGIYSVTVIDNSGFCIALSGIVITEPLDLTSLDSVNDVSCFGGNNGNATVQVTGGTSPYSYLWDVNANSQTTLTAANLNTGNYLVTMTDFNGCQFDTNVVVNEPLSLTLSDSNSDVSCFGGSDGSITVNPSGGTAPYFFLWDANANNQTNNMATALIAGSYTVTVTDTNGCIATTTVTTSQPSIMTVASTQASNVGCYGDSNGIASVTVNGGIAPYSYSWSVGANSQTTASAANLISGTYNVTVSDTNGCSLDTTVLIAQPTIGLAHTANITNVACFGDSTGVVNVIPSGGTSPYTFHWDSIAGNPITSSVSSLPTGNYSVIISDSNNCKDTGLVVISQPTLPLDLSTSWLNVNCYGDSSGTGTVTVIGGTSPYQYLWSYNNQIDSTAINLLAGTYQISVTDTNGCMNDTMVVISQPDSFSITSIIAPVSCFGGNNGSVSLSTSGGVAPYIYQWAATANSQTISTATGLTSGTHQFTITDSNGCVLDSSVFMNQPILPISVAVNFTAVSCNGGNDGMATTTITGGTSPYSNLWSGQNTSQLTDTAIALTMGNYSVIVTDSNGCVDTSTVNVTEPTLVIATEINNNAVACFGDSTGSGMVQGSGGVSPYTYLWPSSAGNQITATGTGLYSGSYIVTVTDFQGCDTNITVTISQPLLPLSDTIITFPVSCFNGNNGIAISNPSGGTAPYSYVWSANANSQISDTATSLFQGTYSITVIDSNNCTVTTSAVIVEPPSLTFSTVSSTIVGCYGGATGTATIAITGGVSPYTYAWSSNSSNQINPTATNLASGTYGITVSDANGCTADTVTFVDQTPTALNVATLVSDVNCFGGNDGTASAASTGGTLPYIFNWNAAAGSQSTPIATSLATGNYQVIVTDSNGCLDTGYVFVNQPNAALDLVTSSTSVSCNGFSNGQATVVTTGGTPVYSAVWGSNTGHQTGNIASGLISGNYNVTITDTNGCADSSTVFVNEPNPITISVTPDDTVCTQANFNMGVTALGGNGGYYYAWNNGLSNSDLHTTTTVNSNVYTVSVTDVLGCPGASGSINITVFNMDADSLTTWSSGDICKGDVTTIGANYAGANSTFTYNWSHGLGQGAGPISVSPPVSTIYQVTVTDACNSSVTEFVIVNLLQAPIINTPNVIDEGCGPLTVSFGDNINDSGNPTYVWSFGDGNSSSDSTPVHTYTNPGTYHITVTKTTSLGCSATSNGQSVVVVYPFPVADAMADKYVTDENDATINFTDLTVGATSIKWEFSPTDFSFIPNPIYTYTDTGTYSVLLTAENQHGCVSDYQLEIIITPDVAFDVPNAFIPSADGGNGGTYDANSMSNDVFFPRTEYVANFHMSIFNRWGEMVFESNDVNIGWDGYYRGQLSAQDVYIWKIDVVYLNGSQISEVGDLTLIK